MIPISSYFSGERISDYKDKQLTTQIQNLVTKVSEKQNDLKKKDKIKTLKKMFKKNSSRRKETFTSLFNFLYSVNIKVLPGIWFTFS